MDVFSTILSEAETLREKIKSELLALIPIIRDMPELKGHIGISRPMRQYNGIISFILQDYRDNKIIINVTAYLFPTPLLNIVESQRRELFTYEISIYFLLREKSSGGQTVSYTDINCAAATFGAADYLVTPPLNLQHLAGLQTTRTLAKNTGIF